MSEKKVVKQSYLDKVRKELKNGEGKEIYKLFNSPHYNDIYHALFKTPKNLSALGIEFLLAEVEKEEDLIGIPQETDGEIKSQLVILYEGKIIPYKKTETENIKLKVIDRSKILSYIYRNEKLKLLEESEEEREEYNNLPEEEEEEKEKYEVIKDEKDIENLIKIVTAIITEDIDEIYYSELYFNLLDNKKIRYKYGRDLIEEIEYKFYQHKEDELLRVIEIDYKRYRLSFSEGAKLEEDEKLYFNINLDDVDFVEMAKKLRKLKLMMEDDTRMVEECIRRRKPFPKWGVNECTYRLKYFGYRNTYLEYSVIVENTVVAQMKIPEYIGIDQIIDVLEMIMHNGLEPEEKTIDKIGVEVIDLMEERKSDDDDDDDIDILF